MITAETVQQAVQDARIRFFTTAECGRCGVGLGFDFTQPTPRYMAKCNCGLFHKKPQERTWRNLAVYFSLRAEQWHKLQAMTKG